MKKISVFVVSAAICLCFAFAGAACAKPDDRHDNIRQEQMRGERNGGPEHMRKDIDRQKGGKHDQNFQKDRRDHDQGERRGDDRRHDKRN